MWVTPWHGKYLLWPKSVATWQMKYMCRKHVTHTCKCYHQPGVRVLQYTHILHANTLALATTLGN
jgi:hypothetical protein